MTDNPALIIIDVQKGFDGPSHSPRNNPDAEQNMVAILAEWRKLNYPVIHIQHHSTDPNSTLHPSKPGNAIKDDMLPLPHEKHFTKEVNSAFIGTGLEGYLRENKLHRLVMMGLTTEHCVATSVRMAGNFGFDVTLISDATAAFDHIAKDGTHYPAQQVHNVNLVCLDGEFCTVKTTQELLTELS